MIPLIKTSHILITLTSLLICLPFARADQVRALQPPSAQPSTQTAQEKRSQDGAALEDDNAEKVNVESIKQKYWARGNKNEMGVVQNRTYTKAGRVEICAYGGVILSDPFLNVYNTGLSLGYHFSEYFAVDLLYWKSYASNSSALNTFQNTSGATTNYNKPLNYFGAEAEWSLLYGKLSVVGESIIYYDMYLLSGLGATKTENGTYATPDLGIGQQVYLGHSFSIKLDYRLMFYHEQIKERVIQSQLGNVVGSRNNWSNVIDLGVSFMF